MNNILYEKAYRYYCLAYEAELSGKLNLALDLYLKSGRMGFGSAYLNAGVIVEENKIKKRRSPIFYYNKAFNLGIKEAKLNIDLFYRLKNGY